MKTFSNRPALLFRPAGLVSCGLALHSDGAKTLVAKNAQGDQVFSGPATPPEERKAIPPDVREQLEKLEGMHGVTFRTDGDFQGAETRIMRPAGRGISLPESQRAVRPAPVVY